MNKWKLLYRIEIIHLYDLVVGEVKIAQHGAERQHIGNDKELIPGEVQGQQILKALVISDELLQSIAREIQIHSILETEEFQWKLCDQVVFHR